MSQKKRPSLGFLQVQVYTMQQPVTAGPIVSVLFQAREVFVGVQPHRRGVCIQHAAGDGGGRSNKNEDSWKRASVCCKHARALRCATLRAVGVCG